MACAEMNSGMRESGRLNGAARMTRRCRGLRAFTLIEMLVSLGVLAVALTVVGVVFDVTVKTVSQAAAISEVHASLRQFLIQLEADLSGIETSQSVLIISGRTQRAARDADDLAAEASLRFLIGNPNAVAPNYDPRLDPNVDPEYSNPRTDILSFITSRAMVSNAPATDDPNDPYLLGAKGSPVHVVYGHAAVAEFDSNSGFLARHIHAGRRGNRFSPIPASRWHVSRRAVILLNDDSIRRDGWPNSVDFDALRRSYSDDSTVAGDIAEFDLTVNLGFMDGFVLRSPYLMPRVASNWANNMLYGSNSGSAVSDRHLASVIRQPAAAQRSNLGVHMLPGCAWFQVEFLMPEDPRNSIDYFDSRPGVGPALLNYRDDMPQWVEVTPGQTYIFVPDSAGNRDAIVREIAGGDPPNTRASQFASMDGSDYIGEKRIRTWPYGIRITVRVFDPLGRLDAPIERSLIHRFD